MMGTLWELLSLPQQWQEELGTPQFQQRGFSNNPTTIIFEDFIVGMIVPVTCQHFQANKQCPMTYGKFLHMA